MIIERFRAFEIAGFSSGRFLGKCPESFVNWHQPFRTQITGSVGIAGWVSGFFPAHDAVFHLDRFTAVVRLGIENADVIAVVAVVNLFPFHRDIQFLFGDGLKGIGLCKRYPDTGLAFDLRQFNSIHELELIRALDDSRIISSTNRRHARKENDGNGQKTDSSVEKRMNTVAN